MVATATWVIHNSSLIVVSQAESGRRRELDSRDPSIRVVFAVEAQVAQRGPANHLADRAVIERENALSSAPETTACDFAVRLECERGSVEWSQGVRTFLRGLAALRIRQDRINRGVDGQGSGIEL